ncbi:hypothetical protein HFX_5172 (plasmid) [Haloferax mediterranei ATCC 33500]|uniref:Uncharacterized protein n=1 Tax=Haloferax mediterranei (strain ATCC 33500 / DSM 1411 / JCM 8866 / NBRC 14739 / NCIMB 2177 / R-4) TaxID=523841 RepID=I3R9U6_HALMT|nr:hypothetical protein HFX_5172 [Haloferax mediterranei ATCC 33500]
MVDTQYSRYERREVGCPDVVPEEAVGCLPARCAGLSTRVAAQDDMLVLGLLSSSVNITKID